jgi:GGDEF domain-containing protein
MRHFKHESIQEVNEHIITGKEGIIAKADNDGVNKQDIQEKIEIAERATQYHHKDLVERAYEAADDAKRQNTNSMNNNQKIIDERDEKRWFGEKKNK